MSITTVVKFEVNNASIDDMVDTIVEVVGEKIFVDLRDYNLYNTKFEATVTVTLEPNKLH